MGRRMRASLQDVSPKRPPRGAVWLLLAFGVLSAAPARADSQVGRDFWFAWPKTADATGDDPAYDLDAQLVILAPAGPVQVRVTGAGLSATVAASPGSPGTLRLPRASVMVTTEDSPVARAVHLVSQDCTPFAALFRVPGSGASVADDVARLFPTDMLGTRYLPVAYEGLAEFVVVATRNATTVRITDPHCSSPPTLLLNAQNDPLL